MQLLHQTGSNYKWNLQSYLDDKAGDGFILSPINTPYDDLITLPTNILAKSIIDPQLYMPSNANGKLPTYPYFPTVVLEGYKSSDYDSIKDNVAKAYVKLIVELGMEKIIIPNRYSDNETSTYIDNIQKHFITPYCNEIAKTSIKEKYLTLFINRTRLIDEEARDSLLDWITGERSINGVYLIFDIKRVPKQIKDVDILSEALFFIHAIKSSSKRVIIGFTNTEGILFSLANPDAITCGSYENLRNFTATTKRFAKKETDKKDQHGPNARLYSGKLFQWIEYSYIKAFIANRYGRINEIFTDSRYRPLFFEPSYNWHFNRPDLYKHYFIEIYRQIKELPIEKSDRRKYITDSIKKAIEIYDDIAENGILLDSDSNGSHLSNWYNAITIYDKLVRERL